MRSGSIELKTEYPFIDGGKLDYTLMDYPWDMGDAKQWKRPAVIVVPGGAYGMVSRREGEPIATWFMAQGFQTFVLWYLVAEDGVRYPEQLLELASAVDYVKKHAEEMNVNADEIFVVGFSAGGHLVANLAVEHQNVSQKAGATLHCRPMAVGLCYPVISKVHGHEGSYVNLLNGYTDEAKEELLKTLNVNEAVSKETPPAFIWTTAKDTVVPPDNALRYALALDAQGIPYELHVYPHGEHGAATGCAEINEEPARLKKITRWMKDCAAFFKDFVIEKI